MNSHICVIDISFFYFLLLNWVGVIPLTCLKEVLKCLWQEKPTLQDMSLIFMLVFVSKQIFLCIVFLIFSVWS